MNNPVATYRLQFHKGFTFNHLERIIPYLHQLGVSTVYASPIFEATPGSMHGYDVVNPLRINPEIGTLEQLYAIHKTLAKLKINWLQDIVPNHMAFDQHNDWLMDVLQKGRESAYADYFDIFWDSPVHNGKLMAPFLGSPLDDVINNQELQVVYKNDSLYLSYIDQLYPINDQGYTMVIQSNRLTLAKSKAGLKSRLRQVNSNPGLLRQIADEQYYQLCFWQDTDHEINYRRFFTVNGLICLNIQHQQVFDAYHQLIKKLLDDGIFQGLRVDHIDGLYNPPEYLTRLRRLAGDGTYIIVEKILEQGEAFPTSWNVQGNTGYDFLSTINNLFTNVHSKQPFSRFYRELTHKNENIQESIRNKKALILHNYMAGELENLYRLFLELELFKEKDLKGISTEQLKTAIGALLIYFPVYRFYGNHFPLERQEADALEAVFKQIGQSKPDLNAAIGVFQKALLKNTLKGKREYNKRALVFYQRVMQFAGPLMAKGVEDTLMYTYNRFIDHNEVGDSPEAFGLSIQQYHQAMLNRQEQWPLSMNASSTHDTKRGEDVRARLNVLTDIPDEWIATVQKWKQINAGLKVTNAPDDNDEYFIYQTITGAYPMPGQGEDGFTNRLQQYLVKAIREAKRNSNWAESNTAYEEATNQFVVNILDKKSGFWKSFSAFHTKVADYGIVNSLAQVLLKYTSPGMPDLYQGCELWDLSLVDPDNRRPVDYAHRESLLKQVQDSASQKELWKQLWQNRYNAHLKLTLVNTLLTERKQNPELFNEGEYLSLKVKGKYKANLLAFARRSGQQWYVIALPLQIAALDDNGQDIAAFDWEDTRIDLPNDAPAAWQHLLSGTTGYCNNTIKIADVFKTIPLAILKLKQPESNRGAGILMHITSLPSAFGVGDLGPEAYLFADFLFNSRQKYWQMLPVNPTDRLSGNSPYSSTSSMAGNVLLVSPELLVKDGWLKADDLKRHELPANEPVDYPEALKLRNRLFELAFQNFQTTTNTSRQQEFENFKTGQTYWLDDYALYEVLKASHFDKPWYKWPAEFKLRKANALKKFAKQEAAQLDKVKWVQFVFYTQWRNLKLYCNDKNLKLLGDMPFYVNHDSADVWANPRLFKLDSDGNVAGMAGVPPDYFCAEGQLWGMPVYNWDVLKNDGYSWWITRIKKNLDYFDMMRLDHFRAFANYWEVPAGEKNAINGVWNTGPGADFFKALKKQLGTLPFIAEDLGEMNNAIYQLRDDFKLPGMKVLQFAFGADMPYSIHLPHNYTQNSFVYTGTHDNNTTLGWYNQITKAERKRIAKYVGSKLSGKNVHRVLSQLCYASIAKTAIIPMQDVLGLDEHHRMNTPSVADDNWTWRLKPKQINDKLAKWLRRQTIMYGR